MTPPSTGFVAMKLLDSSTPGFRIAATGVVTELDAGTARVVKKLKLVGEPKKVFKNTCFVEGSLCFPCGCARCVFVRCGVRA